MAQCWREFLIRVSSASRPFLVTDCAWSSAAVFLDGISRDGGSRGRRSIFVFCFRPVVAGEPIWLRLRKRAGLDGVRIHDGRHSYASRVLAIGEGLPTIGELLGHRKVTTTARYAHLARDTEKAAAGGMRRGRAPEEGGEEAMARLQTKTISRRTVEALKVEKDTVFWGRELSGFGCIRRGARSMPCRPGLAARRRRG